MVNKEKGHDSQIVRAKEKVWLSHDWPSKKQVSSANQPINALRQGPHCLSLRPEPSSCNKRWKHNFKTRLSLHPDTQTVAW